ncbi:hypothetical protein SAMN05216553_10279 [Lentzea fradiae]|uniref:Uncharacterized protein n=1 Tax=Lentzea fradiae TaxID=200378 RepID=A0A1G7M4Y0_9PSEU|nr:hypothetical protein [Lentzea fradiae]SDF56229.1 hypothetical protein SAMN05216553_10279 [Lentzea fradiae]
MKHTPAQVAAVVVGLIDAAVLVADMRLGATPLPVWGNYALITTTIVLVTLMVVQFRDARMRSERLRDLFKAMRRSLSFIAICLTTVAFYGGWAIALGTLLSGATAVNLKHEDGQYTSTQRSAVVELSAEEYERALAANQRVISAVSLACAGGVFALSGVMRRSRVIR